MKKILALIRDLKGTRQEPHVFKGVPETVPSASHSQAKPVCRSVRFPPPPALDEVDANLRQRAVAAR